MEIPSADIAAWSIAKGTNPDKPTVLRFRPNLAAFIGDARYPRRLIIFWSFEGGPSGLPDHGQAEEMGAFEDAIIAALDPDRLAILAFVFTASGQREWHFYVSDVGQVGERINEALAGKPIFPIELHVEDDPDWSEFAAVIQGCSEE